VSAEQMLQRIIRRARTVAATCDEPLNSFINQPIDTVTLQQFCSLDDTDVMMAIKKWSLHQDKILSMLCEYILNRKLLKVKFYPEPVTKKLLETTMEATKKRFDLSEEEVAWIVFEGEASNSVYDFENEQIKILFKDKQIKDISEVDHALINEALKGKVKKYYLCYPG